MVEIEEVDIFKMEQILLAFKKSFSRLIIEKKWKKDYELASVPGEEWVGEVFLTLSTSLLPCVCCLL